MSPTTRPLLREADVRAMVRLLGEVAAVPGNHESKRLRVMTGLCRLIGADYWVWALCTSLVPGQQPIFLTAFNGGFSAEQFGRYMRAVDHPAMAAITAPLAREIATKGCHLTRLLRQIDPDDRLFSSPVGALWRQAGIRPVLLSYRPLRKPNVSCIGLYRRAGRPWFDERAARIAHIILTEVPWLHEQGWPEDRAATLPQLPPRARTVLNLLIRGLSRKEIGVALAISELTANEHVKRVYRHFGVHSQPQLVSRFFRGDGGDVP